MKWLRLISIKRVLIFGVIAAIGCKVTELATHIDPNVASYIWVLPIRLQTTSQLKLLQVKKGLNYSCLTVSDGCNRND